MIKKIYVTTILLMLATVPAKGAQQAPTLGNEQKSLLAYVTQFFSLPTTSTIPLVHQSCKKAIIFDLNGILCSTNKLTAAQIIGLDTIGSYMLSQLSLPNQTDLFEILRQVPAISTATAYHDGMPLPQIMVDWKAGLQDDRDIQDAITLHLSCTDLTPAQKSLYLQTILMMTTPEKFIATKQIIVQGLQLAQTLKKLGYKIYILSNWDPTSFALFIKNFPDFFTYEGKDLFDGIMISGHQHCLKPDPKIFQACLAKFTINPEQAVFIDDTPENVQAAQNLGIDAILCKNRDITKLNRDLQEILIK